MCLIYFSACASDSDQLVRNVLILATPIPLSLFLFTLEQKVPYASDSTSLPISSQM